MVKPLARITYAYIQIYLLTILPDCIKLKSGSASTEQAGIIRQPMGREFLEWQVSRRMREVQMSMKGLSESDICAKYITPALIQSGWDEATQIRREVFFTKGRIIVRGKLVHSGLNISVV